MVVVRVVPLVALLGIFESPSCAQETTAFAYDALGRLRSVARSGGTAGNVATTYSYDSAGNRTNVLTTGSANGGGGTGGAGSGGGSGPGGGTGSGAMRVVVVPLGGYSLIVF